MSKNEFKTLEQFKNQYTGEWGPSDGHYLGLDFSYNGVEYRFHTGYMYEGENIIINGTEVLFSIYRKKNYHSAKEKEYELIGQYSCMEDALCCVIGDKVFSEVIVDSETELLGQD